MLLRIDSVQEIGRFAKLIPRHRWIAVALTIPLPIVLLTFTIWWRIWDKDPFWALGYIMAILICFAGAMFSIPAADFTRRLLHR
jgi:hypothetical protein